MATVDGTRRLVDGQQVRVDGGQGHVVLLDGDETEHDGHVEQVSRGTGD
jgi:hypothetical protein